MSTTTSPPFPTQPFVYVGLLVLGVVAALSLSFAGVSLNLYMLMYAMSGLIGLLMASFSENVGQTRPAYTLQAFGLPVIIGILVTALLLLLAWVVNRVPTTASTTDSST
jgi:predicted transporter